MGLSRNLRFATIGIITLWLIAQVVTIICFWDTPQGSDAANYANFAYQAVSEHSSYPTLSQFYNIWVANTGYVNFLVANLYLFGTLKFVGIEQLILNSLLLFSFFKLTDNFSSRKTACYAVIIFCLLPSNVLDVATHMSDLFALSLMFCALYLLKKENILLLILSGILFVLSNWARPVAILYIPTVLIIWLIKCKGELVSTMLRKGSPVVIGALCALGGIALLTNNSCGHILLSSTTKGTNMIIGCHDGANGGYDDYVFVEGQLGYIPESQHLNAIERDKELTERSVDWILDNPSKFVKKIPVKMFRLWCGDYYNNRILENNPTKPSMKNIFIWSITYFITLLFFIIGLFKERKQLWGEQGAILLPVILLCGMHILMYGGMRYHYPAMPVIIYFAAIGITKIKKS